MDKRMIWVVDDDNLNLSVAGDILRESYSVKGISSGMQCLADLAKETPDLILLDLVMPEMDGYEVMDRIRSNPRWNRIPVIFLTASTDAETEIKCLEMGAVDFIGKPFVARIMLRRVDRSIELLSFQRHQNEIIEEKVKELERLKYEFTREIANIVEGRDNSTGGHVQRTCEYVKVIVKELQRDSIYSDKMTNAFCEKIIMGAILHDIGKIKISDTILNKPGKLTPEEFAVMKDHATYGSEMIDDLLENNKDNEYYHVSRDIALYHHEKWAGGGYPANLSGTDIPLSARIMAVSDVYDALVSARCYKEPMPLEKAFGVIEELSGTHFEPAIAQAFLNRRQDIEEISRKFN